MTCEEEGWDGCLQGSQCSNQRESLVPGNLKMGLLEFSSHLKPCLSFLMCVVGLHVSLAHRERVLKKRRAWPSTEAECV